MNAARIVRSVVIRYALAADVATIARALKKVFAIPVICVTIVRICACADIVLTAQFFVPNAASVVANVTIITVTTADVATSALTTKAASAILAICVKVVRSCVLVAVAKTARRFVPDAVNAVRNATSIFVTIVAYVQIAQVKTTIALIAIIVPAVRKCVRAEVVKIARRSAPSAENAVPSVTRTIVWNAESVTSVPICAKIADRIALTASSFV